MKKFSIFLTAVLIVGGLIYVGKTPIKIHATGNYTVETNGTINNAEIKIRPTTGDLPSQITSATLEYQKQGDLAWKKGLDPSIVVGNIYADQPGVGDFREPDGTLQTGDLHVVSSDVSPMIRRVYGSIFYLTANTTYNIRVMLKQTDGSTYDTVTTSVTTMPDAPSYGTGRTLNVGSGQTYATINAAWTAAQAGDSIVVQPGTYNEGISVSKSGAQGNPITIRGLAGAVLNESSNYAFAFDTDNVHDIIIEGFNMTCASTCPSSFISMKATNLQRVTIQNNQINVPAAATGAGTVVAINHNANTGGLSNLQNFIFQNNNINVQNTANILFYMNDGKNVVIRNNSFKGAGVQDIIALREGPHENFDFYNNTIAAGTPYDDGMEVDGGININVRYYNNTFDDSAGARGTLSHTPDVVGPIYIFRNTFYAAHQAAKVASNSVIDDLAAGHQLADLAPIFYYQNTIYSSSYNPAATDSQSFFRYDTTLCHINVHLKNNIIVNRPIESAGPNLTKPRTDSHWGQIDSNNNLWWFGVSTSNTNFSKYGLDLNSVFADPKFVSTSDFHLGSSSPALDKGIVIPNINDNYVGNAPDLGRYEFGQVGKLDLIKSVDKNQAKSGDTLTYSINYQNTTDVQITNTRIEDPIPANTTFVAGSASAGGTFDGTKVIWNLGTLDANATNILNFRVKLN